MIDLNSDNSNLNFIANNNTKREINNVAINNYILNEKDFEKKITEKLKSFVDENNILNFNKGNPNNKLQKKKTLSVNSKTRGKKTFKEKIKQILDNRWVLVLVNVFTIYALFGTDLNTIFLDSSSDIMFNIFSVITMIVFLVEFSLSCYAKKKYVLSFIFWMDLISALSMLLEIDWVVVPIITAFIS